MRGWMLAEPNEVIISQYTIVLYALNYTVMYIMYPNKIGEIYSIYYL